MSKNIIKTTEKKTFKYTKVGDMDYSVPIFRDLTVHTHRANQRALYEVCGCGSTLKYKFCCKINPPSEEVSTVDVGADNVT
mgnify:FL=1